jgi:hemolysin D
MTQLHSSPPQTPPTPPKPAQSRAAAIKNSVLLRQSPRWAQSIALSLGLLAALGLIGSIVFKIDEVIPVQGKLEPKAGVQSVQPPIGGVVAEVLVKEGDVVKKGQPLVRFDTSTARAKLVSLTELKDRLLAENSLYRAQLGDGPAASLSRDQQQQLRAAAMEFQTRLDSARLETAQLGKQRNQAQLKLGSLREALSLNERILSDIRPLYEQGGMARIQFLNQEKTVQDLRSQILQAQEEIDRLSLAITESGAKQLNTFSLTHSDVRAKITENSKKLAEIEAQLSEANLTLKYQELKSPVNGTVFDLKPSTGYVANATEPIMKIVPNENLLAKVFITNQDIGFVNSGQPVDVRIDAYPFTEYGSIKGKVTKIGSDALKPDETYKYFRFPADITLEKPYLETRGKKIPLQSGMAVSAYIKLRERPVYTVLTDLFNREMQNVKSIRGS